MATDTKKNLEFEGFKFSIDANAVDDMEFLELSEKVNSGNIEFYPKLIRKLLGDDTYEDAKAYFSEKYGKFSATKCSQLFSRAIEQADPKE